MEACDCETYVALAMLATTMVVFVLHTVEVGTIVWLTLSTIHKLGWGVPVIGPELMSARIDHLPRVMYTRQIYVNVELAFLGLVRRCLLEPSEFSKTISSWYVGAGIILSGIFHENRDAAAYRIHDAVGLLVATVWFYRAFRPPTSSSLK